MLVPLHQKSDYSLAYGTASIEELVEQAAALGYRSLALADLENLYGQVRFHQQCRARGIRPSLQDGNDRYGLMPFRLKIRSSWR